MQTVYLVHRETGLIYEILKIVSVIAGRMESSMKILQGLKKTKNNSHTMHTRNHVYDLLLFSSLYRSVCKCVWLKKQLSTPYIIFWYLWNACGPLWWSPDHPQRTIQCVGNSATPKLPQFVAPPLWEAPLADFLVAKGEQKCFNSCAFTVLC